MLLNTSGNENWLTEISSTTSKREKRTKLCFKYLQRYESELPSYISNIYENFI